MHTRVMPVRDGKIQEALDAMDIVSVLGGFTRVLRCPL